MQYVRPYRVLFIPREIFFFQPDNPDCESAESAWNYRLAQDRQGSLWKNKKSGRCYLRLSVMNFTRHYLFSKIANTISTTCWNQCKLIGMYTYLQTLNILHLLQKKTLPTPTDTKISTYIAIPMEMINRGYCVSSITYTLMRLRNVWPIHSLLGISNTSGCEEQ